jgi:hypothetical protein
MTLSTYSRSRSRGQLVAGPQCTHFVRYRNCGELSYVNLGYYSTALVGETQTMVDQVVPKFRSRVAKGEVFFNPMQRSVSGSYIDDIGSGPSYSVVGLSCVSPVLHQDGYMVGSWLARLITGSGNTAIPAPSGVLTSSEIGNAMSEASTRCRAERGKSSNNLFESLAEYRQTISMFKRPIDTFNRFLSRGLSSGQIQRVGRSLGRIDPAKTWLAIRYGVIPLIRDIQGVIDGLKKKTGKIRETTRASVKIQRYNSTTGTFTNAWSAGVYNQSVLYETLDELEVRAVSLDEYIAETGSNIGFTTKGLLGVPWELITLSFVVDWIVNVGDFIYAYLPSPGYKQLGSCLTSNRETRMVISPTATTPTNGNYIVTNQLTGALSSFTRVKVRQPLADPRMVIKSDFRFDRPTRLLDALALTKVRLLSIMGGKR